jgi:Na+-transporting NADH:ubiquinone oxidoreductase subunit A
MIRMLPFRDLPDPEMTPPCIFVTIGNLEPFHPQPESFLIGREDLFRFGVKILNRLSRSRVYVAACGADAQVLSEFEDLITHTYHGGYPAHDAGVLLYHTKSAPSDNRAWYIDAQDLMLLAELFQTGRYPTRRTVVLGGSKAVERQHYQTRIGVPLRLLMGDEIDDEDCRCIVGGILSGYTSAKDSYLGFYETGVTLLPAGNEREVMASFQPGFRKHSYSRTFLSVFNRGDFVMNCNIHGGVRACIACNHCPDVCPVDILPQLTYKSILVGEVEESLAHGLLDCVECGLCSYVCPSKIELLDTIKKAKAAYYNEQA